MRLYLRRSASDHPSRTVSERDSLVPISPKPAINERGRDSHSYPVTAAEKIENENDNGHDEEDVDVST